MHSSDLNLSPPSEMPALKCREGELVLGLKESIHNPDLRYNNLGAHLSSPTVSSFLKFSLFLMILSPVSHKYGKERLRKWYRIKEKTVQDQGESLGALTFSLRQAPVFTAD